MVAVSKRKNRFTVAAGIVAGSVALTAITMGLDKMGENIAPSASEAARHTVYDPQAVFNEMARQVHQGSSAVQFKEKAVLMFVANFASAASGAVPVRDFEQMKREAQAKARGTMPRPQ